MVNIHLTDQQPDLSVTIAVFVLYDRILTIVTDKMANSCVTIVHTKNHPHSLNGTFHQPSKDITFLSAPTWNIEKKESVELTFVYLLEGGGKTLIIDKRHIFQQGLAKNTFTNM